MVKITEKNVENAKERGKVLFVTKTDDGKLEGNQRVVNTNTPKTLKSSAEKAGEPIYYLLGDKVRLGGTRDNLIEALVELLDGIKDTDTAEGVLEGLLKDDDNYVSSEDYESKMDILKEEGELAKEAEKKKKTETVELSDVPALISLVMNKYVDHATLNDVPRATDYIGKDDIRKSARPTARKSASRALSVKELVEQYVARHGDAYNEPDTMVGKPVVIVDNLKFSGKSHEDVVGRSNKEDGYKTVESIKKKLTYPGLPIIADASESGLIGMINALVYLGFETDDINNLRNIFIDEYELDVSDEVAEYNPLEGEHLAPKDFKKSKK